MLRALHKTKMCVHEEYHLVMIYQSYLFSMWYVMLMRNSTSIMSINFSSWFCLPLALRENGLSHYGGVISYVHITNLDNVNM